MCNVHSSCLVCIIGMVVILSTIYDVIAQSEVTLCNTKNASHPVHDDDDDLLESVDPVNSELIERDWTCPVDPPILADHPDVPRQGEFHF